MSERNDLQPARILIVEDNEACSELMAIQLEGMHEMPVEIIRKNTLLGAMTVLAENGINVIVLDLGLPDATGVDGLDQLRAIAPNVPILAVTGNANPHMIEAASVKGVYNYLIKPNLEVADVRLTVRNAIRHNLDAKTKEMLAGKVAAMKETHECKAQHFKNIRPVIEWSFWLPAAALILLCLNLWR